MPLIDARLRGFIVLAHQGKTAQRHVAQPKPELCGSAWAILKTSISPSAFPNGFFRPPSHIPSPSSEPSRAQSLLENDKVWHGGKNGDQSKAKEGDLPPLPLPSCSPD
jgi:hypothetical protein